MTLKWKSLSKWPQKLSDCFWFFGVFLVLRFAAVPDGPREAPDPQKSQKIIKNDIKFQYFFQWLWAASSEASGLHACSYQGVVGCGDDTPQASSIRVTQSASMEVFVKVHVYCMFCLTQVDLSVFAVSRALQFSGAASSGAKFDLVRLLILAAF